MSTLEKPGTYTSKTIIGKEMFRRQEMHLDIELRATKENIIEWTDSSWERLWIGQILLLTKYKNKILLCLMQSSRINSITQKHRTIRLWIILTYRVRSKPNSNSSTWRTQSYLFKITDLFNSGIAKISFHMFKKGIIMGSCLATKLQTT